MDLHLDRLHEDVTCPSVPASERPADLIARFQGSDAPMRALKAMVGMVRLQAAVMSDAEVFSIMTVLLAGLTAVAVIMKRPAAPAGAGGGH